MFQTDRLISMIARLVFAALFLSTLAIVSAVNAQTRISLGAISESYLGRRASDGSFGFNGFVFETKKRKGMFNLDVAFGRYLKEHELAITEFDVARRFSGGDWKVGVGKRRLHWSPSEYSSLILSRNAPAFPSVYVAKTRATPSKHEVLKWIGPWRGEFFIGLTSDTSQPENSLISGLQFAFQPIRGLELEMVRVVQFGGEGMSSSLSALLGNTNEGDLAMANQIAGIGLSYAFPSERSRFYAQVIGEDEAGSLPSCRMYLAGIELKRQTGNAKTTITLETVDTRIDETRSGNCGPNTAYNNAVYPYVNRGVDLGAVIGSESRSVDLRGEHEFSNWSVDWGIGYSQINDASDPSHRLSSARVSGPMLSIGAHTNFLGGTLEGKIIHQGFDLDRAELGAGLRFGLSFSKSY